MNRKFFAIIGIASLVFTFFSRSASAQYLSISQGCSHLHVDDNGKLTGFCATYIDGPARPLDFNLNSWIENKNGRLIWVESKGQYSKTSKDCKIDEYAAGTTLVCSCQRYNKTWREGASINLEDKLSVVGGFIGVPFDIPIHSELRK